MWSQFVTQFAGQPVDEGRVAKMVLAFPIVPMSLKRITAVRTEKDNSSTGFEHTHHFTNRLTIVLNMFQNFMAKNQIEKIFSRWHIFSGGTKNVRGESEAILHAWKLNIQANRHLGKRNQVRKIGADAATVHQDIPVNSFLSSITEHGKTALLTFTPDVRGLSAFSGFV